MNIRGKAWIKYLGCDVEEGGGDHVSDDIIRKAVPKAFSKEDADGIEDVGLHPVRCNVGHITRSILKQRVQNA